MGKLRYISPDQATKGEGEDIWSEVEKPCPTTPSPTPDDLSRLTTIKDVRRQRYVERRLTERWRPFIGRIPLHDQWTMQIVGGKGSGKSTFALEFAGELARYGPVLYACAEERPDAGTIWLRAQKLRLQTDKIALLDADTLQALDKVLSEGDYAFCIVDSISAMKAHEVEVLEFRHKHPSVCFIFVNQVNARGEARGDRQVGHGVDIVIRFDVVERGGTAYHYAINDKNRYAPTVHKLLLFKKDVANMEEEASAKQKKPRLTWADCEEARMKRAI